MVTVSLHIYPLYFIPGLSVFFQGIAQLVQAVGQALSPAFVTYLFAFSIQSHIFGGNLVYVVLLLICSIGVLQCFTIMAANEKTSTDLPRNNAVAGRDAEGGV